jgi:signal transduction histidine kinase
MEKTNDLVRRAADRRKTFEAQEKASTRGPAPAPLKNISALTHTNRLRQSLQSEVWGREQAEAALLDSEAALLRSHEELRALTASLLHSQDDERRRVSRQLHDELSQEMAKLQFDVETLEQSLPADLKDERRQLLAIRDGVGSLANNVRRIAHQLHPSALDHLGLSAALRAFVREFAGRERLPVRLTARKVPAHIAPEVASSLYRVVQEALRNVAKHAGKTCVTIVLAGLRNQLFLSIRDRGVGFDQDSIAGGGGLGLIAMHERIHLVDGDFSLNTRPGRGVVITIRIPL